MVPKELADYEIPDWVEPSWIEEQRVLRALRRLIIYLDLQEVMRPRESQESEVWDGFASSGYRFVWPDRSRAIISEGISPTLRDFKQWEMQCVLQVLRGLSDGSDDMPA